MITATHGAASFQDLIPAVMLHRLRQRSLISGGHPGSGHYVRYTAVDARVIRFINFLRREGVIITKTGGDNWTTWKRLIDPVALFIAGHTEQPWWIVCVDGVVTAVDDADDICDLNTGSSTMWMISTMSWW